MIRRPQALAFLAAVLAVAGCRAKDDFKSPSGGTVQQDGAEVPAPAPAPVTVPEAPSDVTAFVPATDAVEITGSNLQGGGYVATLSVLTAEFKFAPLGVEVPFDPATRSVKLGGLVPRAFGPTTPLRLQILDATTRAVKLCGDTYVGATAVVLTRATAQGCGLLDLALAGDAGRALLPVIDLRTLAELGQVVRVAGAETNPALVAEIVVSFLKVRAAQRSTQTNTPAQEADRLAAEVAATNVDNLRILVENGRWSEVAPGRSANPGATSAVVRDVANGTATGATTLAYALAAITIQATTGKTISVAELIASGVAPGVLLIAADSALSGSSQELLTSVVTIVETPPETTITRPADATGLVATPGESTVTLTWTAPAAGLQVLLIHRSGAAVDVKPVDGKSYASLVGNTFEGHTIRIAGDGTGTHVHTGLPSDVAQHYALWTLDPVTGRYAAVAARASATATAPMTPGDTTPPGNFTMITPEGTTNTLTPTITWNVSTDAVAYDVKVRSTNCVGAVAMSAIGITGTVHTFAMPLTDETVYCFEIVARDAAGNSTTVQRLTTVSLTRPAPPGVMSLAASDSKVDVSWPNGGLNYLLVRRSGAPVNVTPVDGIDYASNPINDGNGNVSLHAGPHGLPVEDSALVNGVTYHYALWSYTAGRKFSATSVVGTAIPNSPGTIVAHLVMRDNGTLYHLTNPTSPTIWTSSAIGMGYQGVLAIDNVDRPAIIAVNGASQYAGNFQRFEAGIWQPPEPIADGSLSIGLAFGADGGATILHSFSDAAMHATTRSVGGTYTGPLLIESAAYMIPMQDPTMLQGANGHLHAIWKTPLLGRSIVQYKRHDGMTWGDPHQMIDDNNGDLCQSIVGADLGLDAAGDPHVVYRCFSGSDPLMYARRVMGSWSKVLVLPHESCPEPPAIIGGDPGNATIIYASGVDCDLMAIEMVNGAPQAPVTLDGGSGFSHAPQVARDPAGYTRVFYLQTFMGQKELREVARFGAASWGSVQTRITGFPTSATLGRGVGISGMANESRIRP